MTQPKAPMVSVFICSYNKAPFVEAALDSVNAQTFRDFELILVDDCSTDDSQAIIESWLGSHSLPCRLVKHSQNQGVVKTVNEILAMVRGRYIASLGSDDVWHPERLEHFLAEMRHFPESLAVLYGDAEVIDELGRVDSLRFIESRRSFAEPPAGDVFHDLLEGNFIPGMSTLIRTDCLRSVGGYDESLWYEDWDMWLRLADRYSFAFLPGALAQYRIVSDSMVRSPVWQPLIAESMLTIRLKWLDRDERARQVLDKALTGSAEELYATHNPLALGYAKKKWRRDRSPRSLVLVLCLRLGVPYAGFCWLGCSARALRHAAGHGVATFRALVSALRSHL